MAHISISGGRTLYVLLKILDNVFDRYFVDVLAAEAKSAFLWRTNIY